MDSTMDRSVMVVFEDLSRWFELPRSVEDACKKMEFEPKIGERIYWYFKDDLEFAEEHGLDIKDELNYSGIVIPKTGFRKFRDEIEEFADAIVVMDCYPIEKEYPEVTWIALNRLLDNDDLVEIYQK